VRPRDPSFVSRAIDLAHAAGAESPHNLAKRTMSLLESWWATTTHWPMRVPKSRFIGRRSDRNRAGNGSNRCQNEQQFD
jgi:hypothetical protein